MKTSLDTSFEITKLVKFPHKRESHLKEIIAEDMSTESVNKTFRSFSQRRWIVVQKVYRVFLHFTKS